jgi:hypothetical protein
LYLPSLGKSFRLFAIVDQGTALGIFIQEHEGQRLPVAFMSKLLNLVFKEWPECVLGYDNHCPIVEESTKLTLCRGLNCEHSISGQEYIKSKCGKMADRFSNPEI